MQKIGAKLYQPRHSCSAKGVLYCFIRRIATPTKPRILGGAVLQLFRDLLQMLLMRMQQPQHIKEFPDDRQENTE